MRAEYPHNQFCHRLKCPNLLGSLVWASGLIPLDCLYLIPLQRHFHFLGLTNRFTPPCRSDAFLNSGNGKTCLFLPLESPFQAEFTIFMDASTQGWGTQIGVPRFGVLDLFRPQAPHQHFGAQGGNFGPPSLGFSFSQDISIWQRYIPGCLNVIGLVVSLSRLNQPIEK